MRHGSIVVAFAIVASSLSVSCATGTQVGKNAERAFRGQPLDTSGFDRAVKSDAKNLEQTVQKLRREFERVVTRLKGDIKKKWGQKEVKVADRTVYVKYTQNYRNRAVVDFDHGNVTVETLDDKDPQGSLRNTIVTTLLTTNDPQAVDLFSDKDVTLATGRQPYLQGLVQDQEGNSVRTREQAERFADYLVQNQSRTRTVQGDEGDKTARSVKVPMIQNFQSKKAEKYSAFVSRFSEQYQVSPSLVYAIIRTESNFNPFAVSSAPAYGLMQLVPTSGGRAAYKRVKGTDETPSSEYLFDPEHNIELGTAYLSVLSHNELEGVSNQQSRDYCVIAAYNTGPGNLLRTFSKKKTAALTEINGLEPVGVYDRLRASLPYEETRQYLGKVVNYRTQFVGPTPPK
jgi:membrane-bound lytic murein transglycosylase C